MGNADKLLYSAVMDAYPELTLVQVDMAVAIYNSSTHFATNVMRSKGSYRLSKAKRQAIVANVRALINICMVDDG